MEMGITRRLKNGLHPNEIGRRKDREPKGGGMTIFSCESNTKIACDGSEVKLKMTFLCDRKGNATLRSPDADISENGLSRQGIEDLSNHRGRVAFSQDHTGCVQVEFKERKGFQNGPRHGDPAEKLNRMMRKNGRHSQKNGTQT